MTTDDSLTLQEYEAPSTASYFFGPTYVVDISDRVHVHMLCYVVVDRSFLQLDLPLPRVEILVLRGYHHLNSN